MAAAFCGNSSSTRLNKWREMTMRFTVGARDGLRRMLSCDQKRDFADKSAGACDLARLALLIFIETDFARHHNRAAKARFALSEQYIAGAQAAAIAREGEQSQCVAFEKRERPGLAQDGDVCVETHVLIGPADYGTSL